MKKYGLVFTCLYSRAIHIEMLDDLTSDAFLNGLRCFVSVRGSVTKLYSDNGTNFVGARNLLETEAKKYLSQKNIEFSFNTPNSSHQGGIWERQIRTIRAVLNDILRQSNRLDSASLRTAFYEVAAIVNNRPLGTVNISNDEETPVTPNMIMTGRKESTPPPPGQFDEAIYCRARWKRVQWIAEEFWRKWKLEYLDNITRRQKWTRPEDNLKVGDVVLIVESNEPRNCWNVGRVEGVYPGKDGLVRKAKIKLGSRQLDMKGQRIEEPSYLERPVQKLVRLLGA